MGAGEAWVPLNIIDIERVCLRVCSVARTANFIQFLAVIFCSQPPSDSETGPSAAMLLYNPQY